MNGRAVFLISMVPLIELRGAIPYAVGFGLPIAPSILIAVIGNMIPVPFIFLFARRILEWGKDKRYIGPFFNWCLEKGEKGGQKLKDKAGANAPESAASPAVTELIDSVYEALCDDLNTPIAIADLFEAVKMVNGGKLPEADKAALKKLFEDVVFGVLGLRDEEAAGGSGKAEKALEGVMEIVLEDRRKARAEKNWAESDRIRDLLASFGITVKDTKEGATWTLE